MKRCTWILVVVLFFSWAHSAFAQTDPLGRALLLYERRDFEGALQETNRVIQQIPTYSRAYTLRGQIKKERRDFDGAMADFNKALELNPKDSIASYLKVTGSGVENPRQPRQSRLKAIFEAKME